ncbi:hypothetical protein [Clostridium sp. AM58-1XD]|uniref:hypothetical protein n=1 Tax=Clostridium sp. AM58-1XD TaxID=2292307 RepID=UPI000E519B12|nr:hypothetical protein [Clostridium sp. AM58-1XD]RGY99289.1 hypothetical protein DXA13_08725 [Clostridium sp. AM58-1XD]
MKKRLVLLVAAITAVSMWAQGCSKPAEKAETTEAVTTEAASAEETTAEETTEAEETEAAEAAASESAIPAEYEKYLSWTSNEWSSASDEEKSEGVVAYVLYDAIVYQGVKGLTAEEVKKEPQLAQIRPMLENSFANMGDRTMKEICDLGHSTTVSLDDIDLPADVKEKLQVTASKWAAASDDERVEIAKCMVLAVGLMTGQEITMEQVDGLGDEILSQVTTIDGLFSSGLYGEATLYEILGSA